jgi:hypothetical protein
VAPQEVTHIEEKHMSSIEQQLNELIANMTPEQIRKVMTQVKTNGPVKVDSRYKARRIAITELYHKSAPKPHQLDDFADYLMHSDSIREQVVH